MSRHQGNKKKAATSRQGGGKKESYARGNAPVSKTKASPKLVKQQKVRPESDEIRLNKYIANSGVCSRREADIYIQSGTVKVNGTPITELGYKVKPGDVVDFDGTVISPEKREYILLNKPKNFTTSDSLSKESRNVLDLVRQATKASLQPVGRMDKNTTGLLLLTNDTDMIRKFSLPNQKTAKIYQVSLDKNLRYEDLEKISGGVVLEESRLSVDEISYIENEPKSEIGIKLRTPNVKVVRAIFEKFGYNVLKVDRVYFAGLTKKNLPRGHWRFLTDQEIINLRNG